MNEIDKIKSITTLLVNSNKETPYNIVEIPHNIAAELALLLGASNNGDELDTKLVTLIKDYNEFFSLYGLHYTDGTYPTYKGLVIYFEDL